LKDPAPLLESLADPGADDLFRHRLALAAECMPAIRGSLRAAGRLRKRIDHITGLVFALWWRHSESDTMAVIAHGTRALPALALSGGILKLRSFLKARHAEKNSSGALLDLLADLLAHH